MAANRFSTCSREGALSQPQRSFAFQVLPWLAMRQMLISPLTAAASHGRARRHRADQVGKQGLALWGVQVDLGGGAAEGMVGAV